MEHVPRSEYFDDVYFSVVDGLAESRHVFLAGNHLPENWVGKAHFTVCETGFGTGLNFLALLKLWRAERPENGRLHFISFEKYPLTRAFIADHLAHWQDDIGAELDDMLAVYPEDLKAGGHDLMIGDDVHVTLMFGDVNEELPKLINPVDCWFLDGFKPSSNPEMWSDIVFASMARLSAEGATFATFTAAGPVRRGLMQAGFKVEKIRGFGRKREMAIGVFKGTQGENTVCALP